MSDKDLMPYGRYKGREMGKIPAPYFMWMLKAGAAKGRVLDYINGNLDILKRECSKIPKRVEKPKATKVPDGGRILAEPVWQLFK